MLRIQRPPTAGQMSGCADAPVVSRSLGTQDKSTKLGVNTGGSRVALEKQCLLAQEKKACGLQKSDHPRMGAMPGSKRFSEHSANLSSPAVYACCIQLPSCAALAAAAPLQPAALRLPEEEAGLDAGVSDPQAE